ncbi:MAG: divalent-cation tolerance protein CutA [Candidatus Obscuribacterales bacterium]|jgi:periplasmic divalent cation tolerance protein|nr:divalent-cation tolerance protein CutA [Cyanobacteria bacterium SZAS LIN-5]RTL45143.1 MAG: divalent-cation tolerance protein CutA [Candidatus Melainabacteria bacterium]
MPGEIIVLVTCQPDDASKLATDLVSERLAACVNVLPGVTSIYRWQDKVEKDSETLLLIKSHRDLFNRLEARIKELHKYDVPEILSLPIEAGHGPYMNWLNAQLQGVN